jgi:hypothetical protein
MRFINSYYDYSPIDLAKFADAHRTELCSMCDGRPVAERLNGRTVAHCGLCKGQGRRRVALIECDDCQRLIPCEDALTVYVGPGEDRGDSIYRPMCKPCDELDVAHSDELERRVIEELELEDRAYWARVERRGR